MKHLLLGASIFAIFWVWSCGGNDEGRIYTGVIEGTTVEVPALTPGRILVLKVDTGYEVQSGDTLAVIDTTELVLQKKQLTAGIKEIGSQESIVRIQVQQAESDLEYIRERHRRVQALYQSETVPQQNLDDITNQLERAQAAYQSARQNLTVISAKKEQLESQIALVNKKIRDAVLLAPISGIVSGKYFESGEAVPPNSPVAQIIDISEVWVKIYISETRLPYVQYGQEVAVGVDGLDADLTGRISWVSPKAEFTPKTIMTPETRTSLVYAVKVSIPNERGILKHGMPVEVRW